MISKKKKGGCDIAVASPFFNRCLVGESPRYVAAGAISNRDTSREWNPIVHRDDRSASTPASAARIAMIVARYAAAQNYAENRPENSASRRAAADAAVATNRRRTARVGNLNWLRPRSDWGIRKSDDRHVRNGHRLRLDHIGRSLSLRYLGWSFARRLVTFDRSRLRYLSCRRTVALDRGDDLARRDCFVAKGNPRVRGRQLEVLQEVGADSVIAFTATGREKHDTSSGDQQVALSHLVLLSLARESRSATYCPALDQMVWLAPPIEAMAEPGLNPLKAGVWMSPRLVVSSGGDGRVSQRW